MPNSPVRTDESDFNLLYVARTKEVIESDSRESVTRSVRVPIAPLTNASFSSLDAAAHTGDRNLIDHDEH